LPPVAPSAHNRGAPAASTAVTYTFGSVRVDADIRAVFGPRGEVRLTRKAWELLLLLLERQPSAVSKAEIHARVWPDTFVSESSVQSLVHEIRRAIDDGAPESWIRTVHGIGYRFCGPVEARQIAAAAASQRPAAWLVGTSTRVALYAGENIVGRGSDDVVEIDAATISRHHARIVVGEAVTIEDLASKNGTWIDEVRLGAARLLADGASVRLGSVRLTFRLATQPRATESAVE
jgi:DNA-binding winged helix-turn-helix (wHTH) protein